MYAIRSYYGGAEKLRCGLGGLVRFVDDEHLGARQHLAESLAQHGPLRDVVCEPAFDEGEVARFRGSYNFV